MNLLIICQNQKMVLLLQSYKSPEVPVYRGQTYISMNFDISHSRLGNKYFCRASGRPGLDLLRAGNEAALGTEVIRMAILWNGKT